MVMAAIVLITAVAVVLAFRLESFGFNVSFRDPRRLTDSEANSAGKKNLPPTEEPRSLT